MKNILANIGFVIILFFLHSTVFGQKKDEKDGKNNEVKSKILQIEKPKSIYLLDNLDFSFVNYGDFQGKQNSKYGTYSLFKTTRKEFSKLSGNKILIDEKKDNNLLEKGIIPLGLILLDYSKINPKAIDSVLLKSNKVALKSGNQSFFENQTFGMVSLMVKSRFLNKNFKFQLNQSAIVSDKEIEMIQVDFGDGKGRKILALDKAFNVEYSKSGKKEIQVFVKTKKGEDFVFKSYIHIGSEVEATGNTIETIPIPDRVIDMAGTNAYIEYANCNVAKKLDKVLLFVEGIDFGTTKPSVVIDPLGAFMDEERENFSFMQSLSQDDKLSVGNSFESRFLNSYVPSHFSKSKKQIGGMPIFRTIYAYNYRIGDFGWDIFRTGKGGGLEMSDLPCLIEKLKADGFDIVLCDFKDGTRSIEENALYVEQLINTINTELTQNRSKKNISLIGASMGGLVTRYALTKMEREGKNHNVKLWATMDSPHNGANIPIGLQAFLDKYDDGWADEILDKMSDELKQKIERAKDKLAKDAPQQMLLYHFKGPSRFNQLRQDENFKQTNFPSGKYNGKQGKLKAIGLSNGSGFGTSLSFNGTANLVVFSAPILGNIANIKAVNGNTDDVLSLRNNIEPHFSRYELGVFGYPNLGYSTRFDSAPGGTRSTLGDELDDPSNGVMVLHRNHCFIPTLSGLALNVREPYTNVKDYLNSNGIYSNRVVNSPYISIPNDKKSICPFDYIYYPNENQSHVKIDAQVAKFAFDMISPKILYLENENVVSNRVEEAREKIILGEKVTPRLGQNLNYSGKYNVKNEGDLTLRAGKSIIIRHGFSAGNTSNVHAFIKPFECLEARNCW